MKTFALGEGLKVDLATLIDTRLLVQANSGGGKSRTIRRLLEQTHGAVQHLVIDLEGEFASLREKFDYVVAAKGGDTPADPRSAALLAERLLELKVSAILDIYELKHADRIRFVRLFLEALVNARKELWHPVLVIVDEAHTFCPEQGEAESASAVIDLCTRGRKRGFCAVLATQRLSKLHKDAAAECNNKLIGRTGLDVDMKRAAYELGFTTKEQQIGLRSLAPGEFFAFGPALSREVQRVLVGDVQTSHPKAGSSRMAFIAPPPTEKVKALLPQLADLPAEVEKRELTQKELKTQAITAERRAREAERLAGELRTRLAAFDGQPKTTKRDTERAGKIAELKQSLAQHQRALEEAMKILVKVKAVDFSARGGEALEEAVTAAVKQITKGIEQRVTAMADKVQGIQAQAAAAQEAIERLLTEKIDLTVTVQKQAPYNITRPGSSPVERRPEKAGVGGSIPSQATTSEGLTGTQQAILDVIAMLNARGLDVNRESVARWLDKHPNGGRFGSDLKFLRDEGYLNEFALNGRARPRPMRTGFDAALEPLTGTQRDIMAALHEHHTTKFTRETLAEHLGKHPNGGRYGSDIKRLRAMGLIPERGDLYLTDGATS